MANKCEKYLSRARQARENKDLSKALKLAMKAERLEPLNSAVLFEIAVIYHWLNELQSAIEYYLKAETNGYEDKGYLYGGIAACYLKMDNGIKAVRFAIRAVQAEPQNNYAQEMLRMCIQYAGWLCGENRHSEACSILKIALETRPKNSMALAYMAAIEIEQNDNYELGQSYMKKAFDYSTIDELSRLYMTKGVLWYDHLNNKAEGLEYLEKAVELLPNKYTLIPLAHRIEDTDPERAERLYKKVLCTEPENTDAIYWLGKLASKNHKWAEAIEWAVKAESLEPEDADTKVLLGYARFNTGDFSGALNCYFEADNLDFTERHLLYYRIGQCYQKSGDLRKSLEYVRKALAASPNFEDAKNLLKEIESIGK